MLELHRIMTERELTEDELTAYHEAAHFVMGMIAMGGLPRRFSIEPDEINGWAAMGYCGGSPTSVANEKERLTYGLPIDFQALQCSVIIAMAGCIFEDVYGNYAHADGDATEIDEALQLMWGCDGAGAYDTFYNFTGKIMSYVAFGRTCDEVAQRLLFHRTLDDDQIGDASEAAGKALGRWRYKLSDKIRAFVADVTGNMAAYTLTHQKA